MHGALQLICLHFFDLTVNPVIKLDKTTYTICVDKIVGDIVRV